MRSQYWDGWKGVCILVVIALHAIPPPQTFPAGSLKWYVDVISSQLIVFPVAIFFAIAGFFSLGRSSGSRCEHGMDYYKRRSARILPPYLIWTGAFILLEHRSHLLSMKELSKDLLLGTGIGIGYFVIVLAQFVLVTPVLAKLNDSPNAHHPHDSTVWVRSSCRLMSQESGTRTASLRNSRSTAFRLSYGIPSIILDCLPPNLRLQRRTDFVGQGRGCFCFMSSSWPRQWRRASIFVAGAIIRLACPNLKPRAYWLHRRFLFCCLRIIV